MPSDVLRWYVVRTRYGETAIADRDMRVHGYEVWAPTLFKPATPPRRDSAGVMRPGKPDRVVYLFVRYIFARLILADPAWRDVLECDGVERVISGEHLANRGVGVPIAVPDAAIDTLRTMPGMDSNGCLYPGGLRDARIEIGTPVRLLDGPLAEHAGICTYSDGKRVMVLLNLLGRPVPVSMAQTGVETL